MQFITPILLCTQQYADETNDIGEMIGIEQDRTVYASEKSAKMSEFYQANANGYKIEKVMVIRKFEYANEEKVKIEDVEYSVLRTFDPKDGNIELVLTKGVNRNVGA